MQFMKEQKQAAKSEEMNPKTQSRLTQAFWKDLKRELRQRHKGASK
jgi:hypothetical protein